MHLQVAQVEQKHLQCRLLIWDLKHHLHEATSISLSPLIKCVGATTLDEYRQHIEKDGALERRFQKVIIEPTTIDETIEILNNIKNKYEDHHNVDYI